MPLTKLWGSAFCEWQLLLLPTSRASMVWPNGNSDGHDERMVSSDYTGKNIGEDEFTHLASS